MNLAILTYHWVANYGANLQAFSTYTHLKKLGHNVCFIDYRPQDKIDWYRSKVSPQQIDSHDNFARKNLPLSHLCRTEEDLKAVLKENDFSGVIVGSDAVLRDLKLGKTGDTRFPNPFWLEWVRDVSPNIPICTLAASNMGSLYLRNPREKRNRIRTALRNFEVISVRDRWTKNNIKALLPLNNKTCLCPDPVLALDDSCLPSLSKETHSIMTELGQYIVVSFTKEYISNEWMSRFVDICHLNQFKVVALPMPEGHADFITDYQVPSPLSPDEWYYWIRTARAYVGERFHAVVVATKNSVPFVCADYYAGGKLARLGVPLESKIYDVCLSSGHLRNRFNHNDFPLKSPERLFGHLTSFNQASNEKYLHWAQNRFCLVINKILDRISKKR